ncbi:MAG: ABC transporter ATP-binding protein [Rhodospirillales bacterium]|jgi:branched-chain amino acid transport system ATP-binding protein|nr:ABC transporter ATP-binding protein [Rhodospirillales bacterium]MDP6773554.1 ABC transporter ATP-binding protein [Rhodospirillales bacterium]
MLELKGINTFRGPAHVLQDVSLDVKEGEVVALVGRNGAGKSTTMESIMGLLPVKSGHVTFHGEDITNVPAHVTAKHGIGYSPEDCGVFPELSVAENLQISQWLADPHRTEAFAGDSTVEERVFSVFPEVRELTGREGINLSGGQRKMVAICRAMFLAPSMLLLDEAFEGLAPVVVNRFRDAMIRIREMGIALLMAESNLAHASLIADRLYAIDRGEIIFHGSPEDAVNNEDVMKTLRG